MKSKPAAPIRLDDLRTGIVARLTASGLAIGRAEDLAGSLLWFDSAGLPDHGVATLPDLLDRLHQGEIDPKAGPKIGPEKAALAVLDGCNGFPLLTLRHAARVASEKAREYGSCIVKVRGIGPICSALAVVSEIAIGPAVGVALGPNGAWSMALPSAEGLPVLADRVLGSKPGDLAAFAPWSALSDSDGWIIQAISVPAMEPLGSFHRKVADYLRNTGETILRPDRLETLRREAREQGVQVSSKTRSALKILGD